MTLGKKEIKLLIALGIILYVGLFIVLFVQNYIPQINEQNGRLAELKEKKRVLDNDLANIDNYKADLVSKTTSNERTENFIYLNADITDCIDYVDKLGLLMQNKINNVKVLDPVQKNLDVVIEEKEESKTLAEPLDESKVTGEEESTEPETKVVKKGQAYIELGLQFKADLTYNEITQLLNFIEGSSKRIKVYNFEMTPLTAEAKDSKVAAIAKDQLYKIDITIMMYSINDNADKLYDYSRSKFNRYLEQKGMSFGESVTAPTKPKNKTQTISSNTTSTSTTNISGSVTKPDFYIRLKSYLMSGDNLIVVGERGDKDFFKYKTNYEETIRIEINNSTYRIEAPAARGRSPILGNVPDRDMIMQILADVPNIKINNKLKLNVKIINNSKQKIIINCSDSGSRTTIMDRDGNKILGSSSSENIIIK